MTKIVDNILPTEEWKPFGAGARGGARPIARAEGLSSKVLREIERLILSGELLPGERVNEYALAEKLAVSRAPVREATRALVQMGLLTSIPARGVFVREMSDTEIAENYDIRALVTGLMCERVAERRSDAEVEELAALVRGMDEAVRSTDVPRYYEINLTFHRRIGEIADHGSALRLYDDLIRATHALRRSLFAPGTTNSEHAELVEAFRERDVGKAKRLGEEHVLHGKRRWKAAKTATGQTS
ncbi:GntR family transcriptional regulator [Aureimonas mangrovi]|uniref:GntR family transcriptional regulator n=1 Tax=Aureimonas mangrovi TaxID=2758041 RepID=UPI00163D7AB8|nr:GntR family transcriptional regulator [Aureimonas mangrovi]